MRSRQKLRRIIHIHTQSPHRLRNAHTGWAKNRTVCKSLQLPYRSTQKTFIYQTVQFFIWSKTGVLNVSAFKYSLRNFSVTTLR